MLAKPCAVKPTSSAFSISKSCSFFDSSSICADTLSICAFRKNFDLLILDEATSALNKDYENEILNSIYKHFKDRIIIIVSHNTTNFMNCIKLIKIENNNLTINIKKT